MEYTLLDSDDKIEKQCLLWNNLERLAVDFEGEFNLHVYGEHLCLIQIYDQEKFYIIDVRSKGVTPKGLELFFSSKVRKLWFDCQSDQALVYKNYGLKIENIYDLRVLALSLGFQGNLISLEKEYLGVEIKINKKKNQQANWLKRPIEEENLEYALLDVAYLIELEEVLKKEIEAKKLVKTVEKQMNHATAIKEIEPGWKRVGSWRHYNEKQKLIVKNVFIARDRIAKRFNVPPARVMSKQSIVAFVNNPPKTDEDIRRRLSKENPRFVNVLIPAVIDAMKRSKEEETE